MSSPTPPNLEGDVMAMGMGAGTGGVLGAARSTSATAPYNAPDTGPESGVAEETGESVAGLPWRGASPAPGSRARRLASIIAAAVMAGEISLLAALTSGDLVAAHMALNRQQGKAKASGGGASSPGEIDVGLGTQLGGPSEGAPRAGSWAAERAGQGLGGIVDESSGGGANGVGAGAESGWGMNVGGDGVGPHAIQQAMVSVQPDAVQGGGVGGAGGAGGAPMRAAVQAAVPRMGGVRDPGGGASGSPTTI